MGITALTELVSMCIIGFVLGKLMGWSPYYQVEDTLFKPTIINGKLTFEVACNL
ncbi:MAG: hypothetical protein II435_03365 [Bacteroidales bacterium]|nr:hypothetical protein [Bacteroidales bacterium]